MLYATGRSMLSRETLSKPHSSLACAPCNACEEPPRHGRLQSPHPGLLWMSLGTGACVRANTDECMDGLIARLKPAKVEG